ELFRVVLEPNQPQDAQKGRQRGRRRVETGGVPLGYVEDFDEPTCLREAASAKAGNEAGGLFQHPT
ncbi:MAG: hypothetical protein ABL960_06290, partial [Nitrospira sp.]